MKTDLIRIGNSRGVRIPKPIIEQCGLGDTVELQVEHDRIVIFSAQGLRRGWDKAFQQTDVREPDEILLESVGANTFDREEWKW